MSYNITLQCGCVVYVACHPRTGIAHTRVLEQRGRQCTVRKHEIGLRLWLWELLPDPNHRPIAVFVPKESLRGPVMNSLTRDGGQPTLGVRRKAC
jgi:hypothetical protein